MIRAALTAALGVDAAAGHTDRLTALRHEAMTAGLLSATDVRDAEAAALAAVDRDRVTA